MKHFRDALAAFVFITCLSLLAGAVNAAPSAIICDSATSADPRTCTAGHYTTAPGPSDLVRVGTGWADSTPAPAIPFTLKQFSAVGSAEAIDACASPDLAPGTPIPVPWTSAADPCKSWAVVPASTFVPVIPGKAATLNVTWALPTTATDGTPLTGEQALTAIQLYVSSASIPDDSTQPPVATFTGDMVQATYTGAVPNGTKLYARVKAVNKAGASVFSGEVSKLIEIPLAAPNMPTNVQISFTLAPVAAKP
jgi:hypothetical protein